jgi:arsenate reductase-like glutaredoxin family protein
VKGNLPIKFADGKSAKLPPKVIELALKKFASFRKPDSKEKLQTAMNKSYKDMVNALKTMREETEELGEGFSPKEIKMAIGVATDKRYKGGNMTGATQAIDKIKKGLSDHPQVRAVLKRVNEDLEEGVDKAKIQKQIDQTEKHMKTFFGNTSSVKMKKFAMQKKIEKLKAQLKEVVSIEEAVLLNRDYKVKGGKVYISKANFRKVHKDFKATAKGNEKMMVNGGSKGTILAPVVFEEVDLEEGQMAGWIAIYKGKKIEIKKDQAKDLYGAKQLAIKQLKVPKSGQGILSITPAYESVNESFEIVQDGGKTEVTDIQEAPNYKLHHNTFSGAVQEAIAVAKKQGYDVDEDDWSNKVATGPKKPSKDKTNRYSIKLLKGGKPTRKFLQIQVYNMGSKYELNCYVQ